MNNNQASISNYLPPSVRVSLSDENLLLNANPPTAESSFEHMKSNLYRERLNRYLDFRQIRTKPNVFENKSSSVVKLREFTKDMIHYFNLTQKMNNTIGTLLREVSAMTELQWNSDISKLDSDTKDLINISLKYNDDIVRKSIQHLVQERQKKRNNISKRKVETKLQKNFDVKRRNIKHQKIDMWFTENIKTIALTRHEMETRQRAEIILMDVKSRKNEANKYILVLESLKKLHKVRNRKTGDEPYPEIDEIKEIWIKASKQYDAEEKNLLKILFDTNNFEEWCNAFFEEPLQDKSFTCLKRNQTISNRILWDKCIVQDDNSIAMNLPLGWACPNFIPIGKWKL